MMEYSRWLPKVKINNEPDAIKLPSTIMVYVLHLKKMMTNTFVAKFSYDFVNCVKNGTARMMIPGLMLEIRPNFTSSPNVRVRYSGRIASLYRKMFLTGTRNKTNRSNLWSSGSLYAFKMLEWLSTLPWAWGNCIATNKLNTLPSCTRPNAYFISFE